MKLHIFIVLLGASILLPQTGLAQVCKKKAKEIRMTEKWINNGTTMKSNFPDEAYDFVCKVLNSNGNIFSDITFDGQKFVSGNNDLKLSLSGSDKINSSDIGLKDETGDNILKYQKYDSTHRILFSGIDSEGKRHAFYAGYALAGALTDCRSEKSLSREGRYVDNHVCDVVTESICYKVSKAVKSLAKLNENECGKTFETLLENLTFDANDKKVVNDNKNILEKFLSNTTDKVLVHETYDSSFDQLSELKKSVKNSLPIYQLLNTNDTLKRYYGLCEVAFPDTVSSTNRNNQSGGSRRKSATQ